MSFEDFKREALQLPTDEREDLTYHLLQSLAEEEEDMTGEHERLWRNEIESRYQEYKEGKAELFDVDEVLAELRAETV